MGIESYFVLSLKVSLILLQGLIVLVLKVFYHFELVAFGKKFSTRNILQGLSSSYKN